MSGTAAPPPHEPNGAAADDPARRAHLARLQQQADAAAASAKAAVDREHRLRADRVALNSLVVNSLLDEKHHSADALVAALSLLRRIVGNVLDAPGEPKFRSVRLASGAYVRALLPLGAPVDRFLVASGWRTRTVDLEKAWVFESKPGSDDWARLETARDVLRNAEETMAHKAARKQRERQERLSKQTAEQERLRLALEDDRQLRALDYEARRRTGPAVSEWQPGQQQQQQQQGAAAAAAAGGADGGEEEEEDDDDEE